MGWDGMVGERVQERRGGKARVATRTPPVKTSHTARSGVVVVVGAFGIDRGIISGSAQYTQ